MTEPEKKRDAAAESPGEPAPEETRSDTSDLEPTNPGGKASTARPEQMEQRAEDTIEDEDGSYREPPD